MRIVTDSNTTTFKLKRTGSGTYDRYTAFLVLCNQDTHLVGTYAIGVNEGSEAITKINAVDATVSRNGDNVTVTFDTNSIWSTGILIAPRKYIE